MASSTTNPWNKASASPHVGHPVTSSLRAIMDEQKNEKTGQEPPFPSRRGEWRGLNSICAGETSSKPFSFTAPVAPIKTRSGTKVINVRVRHLREMGFKDLIEWTKDPKHIYIGRDMTHYVPGAIGSKWHNPFKDKQYGRDDCVRRFKEYIKTDKKIQSNGLTLLKSLHELKGKTLGCWCHPERCHGHALVELIDEYVQDK